jgi:MoxR-like ATPase
VAAKVHALLEGRPNVSFDDVDEAVLPALRHRLIRTFEGAAENVSVDEILKTVIRAARVGLRA